MQTIKLGDKSLNQGKTKDNPILVNSIEEIKALKTSIWYKAKCLECGETFVKQLGSDRVRKERCYKMLCKDCLTKQTNLKKFGVERPSQNKDVLQKMQSTCIERYGTKNPGSCKEVQDKMKQTCMKKFGTEFAIQSSIVKDKIKATCLEKYGVENGGASEQSRQKIKETNLKNFGVEYSFQAECVKSKIKDTILSKFGVDNVSKCEAIKNQKKQTLFNNYGVTSQFQLDCVKCLRYRKYFYESVLFDSSWELAFYVYYIKKGISIIREPLKIPYEFNGGTHYYFPDFMINGQLYEIKGDQFFREDGVMYNPYSEKDSGISNAKYNCALSNNVIFIRGKEIKFYLDFMENEFGKGWKNKFLVA